MIAEAFFNLVQTEPEETKQMGNGTFHKTLVGAVEFDFGEMQDPRLGKTRIRGSFPRISPKYQRQTISKEDLTELGTTLLNWSKPFFECCVKPKYLTEICETSFLLAAFIYPKVEIHSREMLLTAKLYVWLSIFDDVVEQATSKKVPVSKLNAGFSQLLELIRNNETRFVEVANFPGWRLLFNALVSLRSELVQRDPGFNTKVGRFYFYVRQYMETLRWYAVGNIDQRYSEETFFYFRRLSIFFCASIEFLSLMEQRLLPDDIFNAPSLNRLLELAGCYCASCNDLMGLKKELGLDLYDNTVIFKVVEKGKPLAQATDEMVKRITRDISEYLILRDTVLLEFNYHPVLVEHLELIEGLIDGSIIFHTVSNRYSAVGLFKLTE